MFHACLNVLTPALLHLVNVSLQYKALLRVNNDILSAMVLRDRALHWIEYYLTGREMKVRVPETESAP